MIDLEWNDRNIYDYFESRDFFFPKEIIIRYFLSLKTKPFIILTGISGTGKTKIAQLFADYMCQDDTPEEREKRIAFVSVRPDWMDNKGLLGYYNLLDEKYHATPVLKLLLQARQNPGKLYFVILDEMNLAKVEQYFSDFLSIMESRTSNKPHGEPMELHSARNTETHDGIPIPSKLHIPSNVYFTGTVNVDESTYMFSPKVLDRANVIEFNDVNLESYSKGFEASERLVLQYPDIREKFIDIDIDPFCSRKDYEDAKMIMGDNETIIQEILNILHPHNLHFGYRVINEISRFIVNTKETVKDFNLDDTLDIQILQKILPKLHGSQAKLEDPLKNLLMFCYRNPAAAGESFNEADIDKAIQNGDIRFPCSARKLSRMLRNLKAQGYTSFIE
ncbi:MAG: 5-methylcytosine-specific restriction enzyme B [Deltaproteobacteria bacterium ADurb.Bin135]|nr:MAG: 5-methylcytosine-specific restriction enzyme B [Deltaproteobacteria bacterium ADurb.Bin135]